MSQDAFRPRTRAVHHGTRRSQYGEMAEAIFLTQGFVYDSAEQAAGRFVESGPDEFIYARYGNPTSRMFEDRIAALVPWLTWPAYLVVLIGTALLTLRLIYRVVGHAFSIFSRHDLVEMPPPPETTALQGEDVL